jgi:hypothetical protein
MMATSSKLWMNSVGQGHVQATSQNQVNLAHSLGINNGLPVYKCVHSHVEFEVGPIVGIHASCNPNERSID